MSNPMRVTAFRDADGNRWFPIEAVKDLQANNRDLKKALLALTNLAEVAGLFDNPETKDARKLLARA